MVPDGTGDAAGQLEIDLTRNSTVERMSRLNGPTCDIDQMLAEIEAGRS